MKITMTTVLVALLFGEALNAQTATAVASARRLISNDVSTKLRAQADVKAALLQPGGSRDDMLRALKQLALEPKGGTLGSNALAYISLGADKAAEPEPFFRTTSDIYHGSADPGIRGVALDLLARRASNPAAMGLLSSIAEAPAQPLDQRSLVEILRLYGHPEHVALGRRMLEKRWVRDPLAEMMLESWLNVPPRKKR